MHHVPSIKVKVLLALKSVKISLHQQPETRSVPIFLVLLNPIANFAARKLGCKSIPNIKLDPVGSTVPHEMMKLRILGQ